MPEVRIQSSFWKWLGEMKIENLRYFITMQNLDTFSISQNLNEDCFVYQLPEMIITHYYGIVSKCWHLLSAG